MPDSTVNRVTLSGRLIADARQREARTGRRCCGFVLAHSSGSASECFTLYCTSFLRRIVDLQESLKEGLRVRVSGKLISHAGSLMLAVSRLKVLDRDDTAVSASGSGGNP